MFDLYNKLSKIDVQKSPSPKTLLKVTPQSVEKIVTASKGEYCLKYYTKVILANVSSLLVKLKGIL